MICITDLRDISVVVYFQMTKIEIPDRPVQFSDEELETQRLLMWQCYATLTTPAIHNLVEFVKRVPGGIYVIYFKFRTTTVT